MKEVKLLLTSLACFAWISYCALGATEKRGKTVSPSEKYIGDYRVWIWHEVDFQPTRNKLQDKTKPAINLDTCIAYCIRVNDCLGVSFYPDGEVEMCAPLSSGIFDGTRIDGSAVWNRDHIHAVIIPPDFPEEHSSITVHEVVHAKVTNGT